uniref:Uncharacterized protein n=1 Tax=Sinocyclocheilus anshuiensis TaxID=1608454 RepID=A0A671MLH3_9TELE
LLLLLLSLRNTEHVFVLCWSLWKLDVASVFFIVSKSHAECSPPIGTFMELRANTNLSCLANLSMNEKTK